MPTSNYSVFLDGVTIQGKPILSLYTGKVHWVNNSSTQPEGAVIGSNSNKGTMLRPLATVAEAVNRAVASRGDIIVVGPGHAETYSSAGALALSKAGVCVVGLGSGSSRPTFTLDTATTASITVTAANVTVHNCIVTANFADIVAAFTVSSTDFRLSQCYIKATATNMNFLSVVKTGSATSNACDGLTVDSCTWIEPDAATLNLVTTTGTNNRISISNNHVNIGVNNNVAAILDAATGKIVTNVLIKDNIVYRLNTDTATGGIIYKTDGTTSTGIMCGNFVQHADTAAEILITASNSIGCFNNYASGVPGASGYLLPGADS